MQSARECLPLQVGYRLKIIKTQLIDWNFFIRYFPRTRTITEFWVLMPNASIFRHNIRCK